MTRLYTNRWNAYGYVVLTALLLVVEQVLLVPATASASPGAPPSTVPTALAVPAGHTLVFSSRAHGVQIYTCVAGVWTFHAPSSSTSYGGSR